MAALPMVFMAAATVVSTIGAITSSQAEASGDKYNAQVAEQNAVSVQQQAVGAAQIQQEQARRTIGAATAAYGASGVSSSTGTALDVLSNSAAVAERDRQNIMYKGRLQAAGYEDQASLDRAAATNSLSQGWMKASGALLAGGSKISGMLPGKDAGTSPGSDLGND